MENNDNQQSAYHEAGRVVFAYLCGYACDHMELPGNGGSSRLNSGNDAQFVQAVHSGNPMNLPAENLEQGIAVAKKLMVINSAGTCARLFYENKGVVPAELDIDIPGNDLQNIEKIQAFLRKAIVDYPEDYLEQTFVSVFTKLQEAEVWKAVKMLAELILSSEKHTLNRFYIEDTLMVAGIKVKRVNTSPGYSVGIKEDETPKAAAPEKQEKGFDFGTSNPLDILLRDFLNKIKKDWKEGEQDAAIGYLNEVYGKYGR